MPYTRIERGVYNSNRPGTGFGRGREWPKFGRGREFFLKYGNCVELVVSRTTNFTYICISKVKHEYNLLLFNLLSNFILF